MNGGKDCLSSTPPLLFGNFGSSRTEASCLLQLINITKGYTIYTTMLPAMEKKEVLLFNLIFSVYVKNNYSWKDKSYSFSVAECIYCKLRNCKVHKSNNKGKCNVPLFND